MKNISAFSVRFPVTIWMIVAAVILLGYISYSRLSVDLFPDFNSPRIFIELRSGELPPEEIEKKFVENMEALIVRQRKVIGINSVLRVGQAILTVEFSYDADMDEAFLDLQKNLGLYLNNPDIDELNISQYNPNSLPVLLIGMTQAEDEELELDEWRKVAENYIRNELIRLDGVAAVEVMGAQENKIIIETNQLLLDSYEVTLQQVAAALRSANIEMSGGSIEELGRNYVIKGMGSFTNLEDIRNVVVTRVAPQQSQMQNQGTANSTPVFLKDLADVGFIPEKTESIVRLDGKPYLALAVYKETQANTVSAVQAIREEIENIRKTLPSFEFNIIDNRAAFIENAIIEVEETALIGIFLAVIILFVFLRRLGATFIISVSIAVSLIATFNLLYFNDLTLNIMTLGGLALGAGMLVDNSIIVVESVFRQLEEGDSLAQAAVNGTAKVSGAITASTLTTIIVFLPIVYLHGAAGELFKDQAWTVAFALVASLVVAVLILPMLANTFLRKTDSELKTLRFPGYRQQLGKILNRKEIVLAGALILTLITIAVLPYLGSTFMPPSSEKRIDVEINLPEGTIIDYTNTFSLGLEQVIREQAGNKLNMLYVQVGRPQSSALAGQTSFVQDENSILYKIDLSNSSENEIYKFVSFIKNYLDGYEDLVYQVKTRQSDLGEKLGTDDELPLKIEIYGDNQETLNDLNGVVFDSLKNIDFLSNVESSLKFGRPQVNLNVDRVAAGFYGVDISTIVEQVKQLLSGVEAGSMEFDGDIRDILIRYPEITLADLKNSYIRSNGQLIAVSDLVKIDETRAVRELYRQNQKRMSWVGADINGDKALSEAAEDLQEHLAKINLPTGYTFRIGGEELKREEAFSGLLFALILSIILIYMVLASQFESLIHPFTIILTVPLAAIGAVWIFLLLGVSLNIMAYIGIIMLMGIAVNDSIILVDAIIKERQDGFDLNTSIINAGEKRIRPIIMTSLTTILALLPLTIGFGESASLRAPMAIAVIGGLVSSTLLTLVVIPCVFYVFEKIRFKTSLLEKSQMTSN